MYSMSPSSSSSSRQSSNTSSTSASVSFSPKIKIDNIFEKKKIIYKDVPNDLNE